MAGQQFEGMGQGYIRAFDTQTGETLWSHVYGDPCCEARATSVAVGPDGDVYVGYVSLSQSVQTVRRYGPGGSQVADVQLDAGEGELGSLPGWSFGGHGIEPEALVVGPDGTLFVGGTSSEAGDQDARVAAFGSDQALLWSDTIASQASDSANGWDAVTDLALDGEGNLYVFGRANGLLPGSVIGPNGENAGPFITKYRAGGSRAWLSQFLVRGYFGAQGMALSDTHGVLLVQDSHLHLVRPDSSDVWSHDSFRDHASLSLLDGHFGPDGDIWVIALDREFTDSGDDLYDLGLYALDRDGDFVDYDAIGLATGYIDVTDSALGSDGSVFIVGRADQPLDPGSFGVGAFILRLDP